MRLLRAAKAGGIRGHHSAARMVPGGMKAAAQQAALRPFCASSSVVFARGFGAPRMPSLSAEGSRAFSTNLELVLRQADSTMATVAEAEKLVMAGWVAFFTAHFHPPPLHSSSLPPAALPLCSLSPAIIHCVIPRVSSTHTRLHSLLPFSSSLGPSLPSLHPHIKPPLIMRPVPVRPLPLLPPPLLFLQPHLAVQPIGTILTRRSSMTWPRVSAADAT
jgi:hypothetical protein